MKASEKNKKQLKDHSISEVVQYHRNVYYFTCVLFFFWGGGKVCVSLPYLASPNMAFSIYLSRTAWQHRDPTVYFLAKNLIGLLL